MNFFWKPYTRWGINSMQYTMATHKVIQNIGHLLWGFTFDLFLASHQWILFTKPDENLKIWYKHRKHELINWWLFDCWIKEWLKTWQLHFVSQWNILWLIVFSINSRYDLQSVTNFQHNEQYPNLKQNRLCSKILTIITTKYAIQFKIAIPHTSLNVGILWTANNLFYFLIKHNTPKIRACKPEVNQNLHILAIGVSEINCT